MIMCVGLFGHSAVVFHVFSCFYVLLTVVVFCIAASLFNRLTYLLTAVLSNFIHHQVIEIKQTKNNIQ